MNKDPIIIIDDDEEDTELIKDAFRELKIENEIITFNSGIKFLDFVRTTANPIFLIICDVNMSPLNGIELKQQIFDDKVLRLKCVPFIFLSTSKGSQAIMQAYSFGVQGYFVKANSFEELKDMIVHILNYWKYSQRPR